MLEFRITEEGVGMTRLTATAFWQPAGVWGLLYWYSTLPFHAFLFRGMVREIARRAIALSAS